MRFNQLEKNLESMRNGIGLIGGVLLLMAAPMAAADSQGEPGRASGKPNPLNNLYFGEQHLHTTTSVDAYIQGNHKTQSRTPSTTTRANRSRNGSPARRSNAGPRTTGRR